MRIMVDTNVLLDILQKREPFFADSYKALRKAIEAEAECLLSASAVTDIFYVLRKALQSPRQARERLEQLAALVTFADVTGMDIHAALSREMQDFEDAVVDAVAERNEADCILTRNAKDFFGSVVPAISPTDFLSAETQKSPAVRCGRQVILCVPFQVKCCWIELL